MQKRTIIIISVIIILVIVIGIVISIVFKDSTKDYVKVESCAYLGCSSPNAQYAGSINSDKFYACGCHYAERIKPENLVCFDSKREAEADGRVESKC